jgi:hypothetical protein
MIKTVKSVCALLVLLILLAVGAVALLGIMVWEAAIALAQEDRRHAG